MRVARALRRFLACRRGSVLLIQLAGFVMVAGILSLAVDAGSLYLGKERLQGALDVAVLKAVTDRDNAADIVQETLASNMDTSTLVGAPAIEYGRYPPTGMDLAAAAGLAVEDRFEAGAASPNALRVTVQATEPLYLARLFFGPSTTVGAAAVAYNKPLTQVAATARGLTIDAGKATAMDAILSGLFGTNVTLSVLTYQALVDSDIRLLAFLDALATEIGVTAGDYGAVLSANVTFPEVADAMITAIGADGDLAAVAATLTAGLTTLETQIGGAVPYALGDVITLDADDPGRAANARVSLYDLLRANAELANLASGATTPIVVPVAGAIGTIWLAPTQPTQISAVGGPGVSVTANAMRVYVEINPAALANILGNNVAVRFPLLLTLGSGTAEVAAITCPSPDAADATVQVDAGVTGASASLANIDVNALGGATPPAADPAEILNLAGVVTVTGTADVAVGAANESLAFTAPFTYDNIQTVEAASPLTTLMTNALADINLTVTVLGLPLPPTAVTTPLLNVLGAVAPAVDTLLGDLLAALGVELAAIDVAVPYVRCSNPTLAQ